MKVNRGIVGATNTTLLDCWPVGMPPRSTKHEPIVYYMRLDRLVKIGWTINLRSRTSSISPQGVLAIEPGGRYVEERRHMQFATLRSHGEWFWLGPRLADHIADLRAALEAGEGITTEQWLEAHRVFAAVTINPGPADA